MLRRYLGDEAFIRSMLRLALPIALQNLLITSFALVDAVMVAQLGDVPLAAVGFCSTWTQFFNYLIFGLSSGAAVFVSRYWGMRDFPGIRRTFGFALAAAALFGSLFLLASFFAPRQVMLLFTDDPAVIAEGAVYLRIVSLNYLALAVGMVVSTVLRSTEQVRLPLISSACGVAVNILLNYMLIFGHFGAPRLGLRGAAIASVVSVYFNLAVLLLLSLKEKNIVIAPPGELFSFDRAFVRQYLLISLPVFVNELIWGGGRTVSMAIFGHLGTDNFAALTAVRTVEAILMVTFIGLCSAAGILIGKRLGEGETENACQLARYFCVWVPLLSVFFSLLLVLLRVPILGVFSLSETAMRTGLSLMLVLAADIPFHNYGFLMIVGVFRAGGDTRVCLIMETLFQWGVAIPMAALLGLLLQLPFPLVYAGSLLLESSSKSVVCALRFPTRRWIRTLARSS